MKGNTNKMVRLHYYEFYELKHEKQGEQSTQAFTELTALQNSQLMVCQISFNTEGAEFCGARLPCPLGWELCLLQRLYSGRLSAERGVSCLALVEQRSQHTW